jgi:hypothetical protein
VLVVALTLLALLALAGCGGSEAESQDERLSVVELVE